MDTLRATPRYLNMKTILFSLFVFFTFLFVGKTFAQFSIRDSVTKKKITLIFINKDSLFNPDTKQRMIHTFFKVYRPELKRFNRDAPKRVTFIIDPAYKGVAATGGGVVRYNPVWMKDHPEDLDVVTHEVMHLVQSYGRSTNPGWLTEGIADYVRYKYGVNNKAGKWSLPDYKVTQSYTNSYRVTARFLVWLEQKADKKIVDKLDNACRLHIYIPEIWKQITGNSLDELWDKYSKDPALTLSYK